MALHLVSGRSSPDATATIGRLEAERTRWRVVVEAWEDRQKCLGRLAFWPDGPLATAEPRRTAPLFVGESTEAVLSAAYELGEPRLRALLRSLA